MGAQHAVGLHGRAQGSPLLSPDVLLLVSDLLLKAKSLGDVRDTRLGEPEK